LVLRKSRLFTAATKLDAGVSAVDKTADFNKKSSLADLKVLVEAEKKFPDLAKEQGAETVSDLLKLDTDALLPTALKERSLIEKGLELVDGPECPLCDTAWKDERQLRDHLRTKLAKSEEARKVQQSLVNNGSSIAQEAVRVMGLVAPVQKLADVEGDGPFTTLLTLWRADIESFKANLGTVEGLTTLKSRLAAGWLQVPAEFTKSLRALTEKIGAKPDQTAIVDAQTFLTTAQLRLADYREAMRNQKAAEIALNSAKTAYDAYCSVQEEELNTLYEQVQEDFSAFYRALNEDDESTFSAKLKPSQGKVDFDVNFYERGLFPPGAYHSEGHQDGMGVPLSGTNETPLRKPVHVRSSGRRGHVG
jgi:hypothetical protein